MRGIALIAIAVPALLWSAVWVGVPAQSEPAGPYVRQTLFSLPYGDGRGKVVAGHDREKNDFYTSLGHLQVPSKDAVLLQNAREVWRFDSTGRLLFAADRAFREDASPGAKPATAPLESVCSFAATPQGRLLVVYGSLHHQERVAVYGADGSLQADVWPKLRNQLRAKVPLWVPSDNPHIYEAAADVDGNWYVCIANQTTTRALIAQLDPQLRITRVRPGFGVGWDGSTHEFAPSRGSQPNDSLLIYRPKDDRRATVLIRPPDGIPAGEYDHTRHQWRPIAGITLDKRGFIYLTAVRYRETGKGIWVRKPGLYLWVDLVVYKFSPKGEYVHHVLLDPLPGHVSRPVAVDPEGNLYHPVFRKDRVEIVKEALVSAD